jgi:hypothetical protein
VGTSIFKFLATSIVRIVEKGSPYDGGSELLQNIGTFIMIKTLCYPGKVGSSNGSLWTICCLSNSHCSSLAHVPLLETDSCIIALEAGCSILS